MKTLDVRALKTKEKLFDAYLQLIAKKPADAITIQELTTLAGINRVTFYKHFQHLANFQSQFIEHHIMALYDFMKPLNYEPYSQGFEYEALVQLLSYIRDNKLTYKVLLTSEYIPQFNRDLLLFFQQKVTQHTEEQAMFDFPGTGVDKDIVAWYGVSALFGTVFMWVRSNFPYAPEELARAITKLNAQSP